MNGHSAMVSGVKPQDERTVRPKLGSCIAGVSDPVGMTDVHVGVGTIALESTNVREPFRYVLGEVTFTEVVFEVT